MLILRLGKATERPLGVVLWRRRKHPKQGGATHTSSAFCIERYCEIQGASLTLLAVLMRKELTAASLLYLALAGALCKKPTQRGGRPV